jgi:hypothetical protein
MELNKSRNIVKTLAQGIHPTTGEAFPAESPYNDPDVTRALFSILEFVKQAKKPRKSVDERRKQNLEFGRPVNSGLPWSDEDRLVVRSGFREGMTVEKLAAKLGRSSGSIVAEVIRQDLLPPELRSQGGDKFHGGKA